MIPASGRSHTSAHLARAAIDAIAYQIADVFSRWKGRVTSPVAAFHADGGATRNSSLMQFQADILGRPVLRSSMQNFRQLVRPGSRVLRSDGGATWPKFPIFPTRSEQFIPTMALANRERHYAGWKAAVSRARLNPEANA